jgi:hypothetical protein
MEVKGICMDYDSMGDCSRFPRKERKSFITFRERLINFFNLKFNGRRGD